MTLRLVTGCMKPIDRDLNSGIPSTRPDPYMEVVHVPSGDVWYVANIISWWPAEPFPSSHDEGYPAFREHADKVQAPAMQAELDSLWEPFKLLYDTGGEHD